MDVETILKVKGAHVHTTPPDATISAVLKILKAERIGAMVVSEDGVSVNGIISERDIVHGLAEYGAGLLDKRVSELMTRKVLTCRPEDLVSGLMGEMTDKRVRHLPVTRDGKLCGLVSIGDVVKNRVEEVEREAEALREYITRG